ncbi:uncharacterized protein LOC103506451 [Diaphorina citri]|uniref:Uncharacterized protein LOC103506451 n=1 Tax=Diaphorina citri TaxID=121845 RepID=A0A1S3CXI1_DIACI|nr:uncharacterized protein LOC103506451 [Diaphorina citri]KAI5755061.1 hypothetical protein M8J77_013730 [Diaphorina citri]
MFEKKCKFQCKIQVIGLTQTPYLCGNLYCRLKLLHGGDFVKDTKPELIRNHEVQWLEEFEFVFQALLDKNTRILKPCILRISVRMECYKRAPNKIGYLDLNLSEFCGFGVHHLRFHLKGYNSSIPPDNSILEISVDTKILQGNVIFKPNQEATPNRILDLSNVMEDCDEENIDISNKQIEPVRAISSPIPIPTMKSKMKIQNNFNMYSAWFKGNRYLNDEILNMNVRDSSRIKSTRLDNDQITDNILSSTFLCMQPADRSQLQLFVTEDGKPVLGQTLNSPVVSHLGLTQSSNSQVTEEFRSS